MTSAELQFFETRENATAWFDWDAPLSLHLVLDLFYLGRSDELTIVTRSPGGALQLWGEDAIERLSPTMVRAIRENRLFGAPRRIPIDQIWLMAIEGYGLMADLPGANDPIEIHGTLFGPFGGDQRPEAISGHLASTRGALLDAFVRGSWCPFSEGTADRDSRETARWHHGALSCGSEADTKAGRGIALGFPSVDGGHGNERETTRLLHDLLAEMKEDPQAPGRLAEMSLPVHDRGELVARLSSSGYEVKGELAVKTGKHWLQRLFPEEVKVPLEGDFDTFATIASDVLHQLPSFPTDTVEALRRLEVHSVVSWYPQRSRGLMPHPLPPHCTVSDDGIEIPRKATRPVWIHFDIAPLSALRHPSGAEVDIEYLDKSGFLEVGRGIGVRNHQMGNSGVMTTAKLELEPARWSDTTLWLKIDAPQGTVIRSIHATAKLTPLAVETDLWHRSLPQAEAPPLTGSDDALVLPLESDEWEALHHCSLQREGTHLLVESHGRDPYFSSPKFTFAGPARLTITARGNGSDVMQVFWLSKNVSRHGHEAHPVDLRFTHDGDWQQVSGVIYDSSQIHALRIDPGNRPGNFAFAEVKLTPFEFPRPSGRVPTDPVVVAYDGRYAAIWNHHWGTLADNLINLGAALVDADQLREWMSVRIRSGRAAGAVCFLTQDCFYDTVYDSPGRTSVVHRFMGLGGRVVWFGDVPFAHRSTPDGERWWTGGHTPTRDLEVNGHADDGADAPELTAEGRAWGYWETPKEAAHRLAPAAVVDVVLARVGTTHAAAWLKTYSHDHPGSGLLRLQSQGFDTRSAEMAEQLFRVGTYRRS